METIVGNFFYGDYKGFFLVEDLATTTFVYFFYPYMIREWMIKDKKLEIKYEASDDPYSIPKENVFLIKNLETNQIIYKQE